MQPTCISTTPELIDFVKDFMQGEHPLRFKGKM
jgi:hypothetical protein